MVDLKPTLLGEILRPMLCRWGYLIVMALSGFKVDDLSVKQIYCIGLGAQCTPPTRLVGKEGLGSEADCWLEINSQGGGLY